MRSLRTIAFLGLVTVQAGKVSFWSRSWARQSSGALHKTFYCLWVLRGSSFCVQDDVTAINDQLVDTSLLIPFSLTVNPISNWKRVLHLSLLVLLYFCCRTIHDRAKRNLQACWNLQVVFLQIVPIHHVLILVLRLKRFMVSKVSGSSHKWLSTGYVWKPRAKCSRGFLYGYRHQVGIVD